MYSILYSLYHQVYKVNTKKSRRFDLSEFIFQVRVKYKKSLIFKVNLYRKLYHLSSWQPNYNSISNVIFISSIVSLVLFQENTGKVMFSGPCFLSTKNFKKTYFRRTIRKIDRSRVCFFISCLMTSLHLMLFLLKPKGLKTFITTFIKIQTVGTATTLSET